MDRSEKVDDPSSEIETSVLVAIGTGTGTWLRLKRNPGDGQTRMLYASDEDEGNLSKALFMVEILHSPIPPNGCGP